MKKSSVLLLLAFTFVYLYTPPLTIFPLQIDILIYGVMALLVIGLKDEVLGFVRVPGLKRSYSCIILLLLYSVLLMIAAHDNNVEIMDLNVVHIIRILIEVIIFPYILVKVFIEKGVYREQIVKYLLCLAIFQAYTSVLMIFVPPFKDFVTTFIITFSESNKLSAETLLTERVFGIGSEYLFGLPIFQAMMACVYISVTKKNLFFFFNLICLICSAIFCARTSLFVFACYFLYYYSKNFKKNLIISVITMGIIGVGVYMAYNYLMSIEGIVAIEHFNRAFNGEYQGYDSLLDSMLFFPEDFITWVFGNGTYAFFAKKASDLGYVNDLFYGGLLYLSLEFFSLYFLYKKAKKADYLQNILPLLFISLIILHYKGSVYREHDFMKGIMIMYYAVFLAKSKVTVR